MTPETARVYLRKVVFRWYCWRKHHAKLVKAIEVLLEEDERLQKDNEYIHDFLQKEIE